MGRLVIGLRDACRGEVDRRAVRRPFESTLVEIARRDLRRRGLWLRPGRSRRRYGNRPDVRVAIRFDVGRISVGAVYGARDHFHVAFVLPFLPDFFLCSRGPTPARVPPFLPFLPFLPFPP